MNCEQIRDLRLMPTFATEDLTTNSPTVAPSDGNQKVPTASRKKSWPFFSGMRNHPLSPENLSFFLPFPAIFKGKPGHFGGVTIGGPGPLRFLRNSHKHPYPGQCLWTRWACSTATGPVRAVLHRVPVESRGRCPTEQRTNYPPT